LPLTARLKLALDLEPLQLGAEIGFAKLLLGAALRLDLAPHVVEIDEYADLRLQDERIDRLEHIVDRAHRVAAHQMLGFLVHRRKEDDRDSRSLLALADQLGGLVAIEARHEDVEQDDREIALEKLAKRVLSRACGDHFGNVAQHFRKSEQIALIIVDKQDSRSPFRRGWVLDGSLHRGDRLSVHDQAAAIADGCVLPPERAARDRPIHTRISASSRSMSTGFEI
jgi:hypothetical protein